MSYVPAPVRLPAFPSAKRTKPKTPYGGRKLRTRWRDDKGHIFEWDSQHGRVERYDAQGRHLGEYDPESGGETKPPDSTRRIEP